MTANVLIGTNDPNEGQAGFALGDVPPPEGPQPPQNGVGFCGKSFSHAGGTLKFGGPIPKPQIFPGVLVDDINLGVQLNPALVRGGMTLSVASISTVHGDMLVIFATKSAPYNLSAADGPGFGSVPGGRGRSAEAGC